MKRLIFIVSAVALLSSCTEKVENASVVDEYPLMFPDYRGVTIPVNFAPLNFNFLDSEAQMLDVTLGDGSGETLYHLQASNLIAQFDVERWHKIMNEVDSVVVTVNAKYEDGWKTFQPFTFYVSPDSIDYGVVYRLIAPAYEVFSELRIVERDLSSFNERTILSNKGKYACFNCHSFNQCNPDQTSFHIRGEDGATLITQGNVTQAYNTRTPYTIGPCAYSYWHPSGKYVAYATSQTRQCFHVTNMRKDIEAFDLKSDVQILNLETNELIVPDFLAVDSVWENFPVFSPDGKTLYYVTCPIKPIPVEKDSAFYSLCSVGFNPANGTLSSKVDTIINGRILKRSVSQPRPSYDGKYILYNGLDYGTYPNFHPDANLFLLDVSTGESRDLTEINSDEVESAHSWSSNSKWIVFASRRVDRRYNRLFFAHIDEDGRFTKAVLLPQEDPQTYYDDLPQAFNVPELISKACPLNEHEIYGLILNDYRVNVKAVQAEIVDE